MFAEQDIYSNEQGPLQPGEEAGLRLGRGEPAPGPGGTARGCTGDCSCLCSEQSPSPTLITSGRHQEPPALHSKQWPCSGSRGFAFGVRARDHYTHGEG